jgi:hypothetical protein
MHSLFRSLPAGQDDRQCGQGVALLLDQSDQSDQSNLSGSVLEGGHERRQTGYPLVV